MSDRRRVMSPSTRGEIGGHEYVDFGLPSGKKWATMNLGATEELDGGDKYHQGYGDTNSLWYDSNKTLMLEHDNAAQLWGNGWRTPTSDEFSELKANTTSVIINANNKLITYTPNTTYGYGYLFTTPCYYAQIISKINGAELIFPLPESSWRNTDWWAATKQVICYFDGVGQDVNGQTLVSMKPNFMGTGGPTSSYLYIRPIHD